MCAILWSCVLKKKNLGLNGRKGGDSNNEEKEGRGGFAGLSKINTEKECHLLM